MPDPRDPGNRGVYPPVELRPQDLREAPQQKPKPGDIKPGLINYQKSTRIPVRTRKKNIPSTK